MTRQQIVLIATLGSIALLGGAFAFQYIGGMAPCKLCLWQRWPHGAAIVIGLIALLTPSLRVLPLLGGLAALTTAATGLYHSGVEQKWWLGPQTCSSQGISGLSPEALLGQILAAPIVRCDEIPWEMLGLSMASWNAVVSLGLAVVWVMAARAR